MIPIVLYTVILLINVSLAQDSSGVCQVGHLYDFWQDGGGPMTIQGDYAYILSGRGLRILDLNDPENPSEVGHCWIGEYLKCITVHEDYAYLGGRENVDLYIVDISNPSYPFQVGKFSGEIGSVQGIATDGDCAYIAELSRYTGLNIIDVSDPTEPESIGHSERISLPIGIDLFDDFVYIITVSGDMIVMDISDPINPEEIGVYDVGSHLLKDLLISDNYLYILDRLNGLSVFNISDPEDITELDLLRFRCGITLDISGLFAYVSCEDGLRVIDVSNRRDIRLVTLHEELCPAQSIAADNEVAYTAHYSSSGENGDYSFELTILDIQDPYEFAVIGNYEPEFGWITQVAVTEQYAFIIDQYNGLRVADISNIELPVEVWFYNIHDVKEIIAAGDYCYIVQDIGNLSNIVIFDVSDPDSFQLITNYRASQRVNDIALNGNFVFLSGNTLQVVDISEPSEPALAATYGIAGSQIEVTGNYLLCSGVDSLWRLDISNPLDIQQAGFIDDIGRISILAVSDRFAFVKSQGWRILIIDIVEDPTKVGFYRAESYLVSMKADNDYLYLANSLIGLRIINVVNPDEPFQVGFYGTQNANLSDMAICGNNAFVIDPAGLNIYDCSEDLVISRPVTDVPGTFKLFHAYPNPFNSITTIYFELPVSCYASLKITDLSGAEVETLINGYFNTGLHSIVWHPDGMASGIYFARLDSPGYVKTLKIVLID